MANKNPFPCVDRRDSRCNRFTSIQLFNSQAKIIRITTIIAALAITLAAPAFAKIETQEPGAIAVLIQDEIGNPLIGATVQVRLPAGDGKLYYEGDIDLTLKDGKTDHDLKAIKTETEDGDVEIGAAKIKGLIKTGEEFEVTVDVPGFAVHKKTYKYTSDEMNKIVVSLQYLLKIQVLDTEEQPVGKFKVTIDGKLTLIEGSEKDADGIEDGILLFNGDILGTEKGRLVNFKIHSEAGPELIKESNINNSIQNYILFKYERGDE